MVVANPEILVRRGLDWGLVWTVIVSGAIHAAALSLLLAMPRRFLSTPPPLQSYTVDLIASDIVGGTNLVPGGGRAKPAAAAAPAEVKPAPAAKPEVAPLKEPPKAAEQPKPAPEPPQAKPAEPKPAPKAEPAAPKVEKPPEPKVAAIAPKPVRPEAKPAKPPEPAPPAKQAAPPKPAPAAAAEKEKPAAKPAESEAAKRDRQIAEAVKRRATEATSGGAPRAADLDRQIAAAVQRRAEQVEKAGGGAAGAGAADAGGPISYGPGQGAGGTVQGVEYILYLGQMQDRIKAAWAWAGADRTLRAVVRFNISPEGEITNVKTIEPSGDPVYDASAERAVRAASPLPPVPERYRAEFSTVELTFRPDDLES